MAASCYKNITEKHQKVYFYFCTIVILILGTVSGSDTTPLKESRYIKYLKYIHRKEESF